MKPREEIELIEVSFGKCGNDMMGFERINRKRTE